MMLHMFQELRGLAPKELKPSIWRWFITDGFLYDWIVAFVALLINTTVPLVRIRPVDR